MKEVDVMGFRVYFASEEPQGGQRAMGNLHYYYYYYYLLGEGITMT